MAKTNVAHETNVWAIWCGRIIALPERDGYCGLGGKLRGSNELFTEHNECPSQ